MGLRTVLKNKIEKLTGLIILKNLPFGIDPIADILSLLTHYSFGTIIDVGANTGQIAMRVIEKLPEAKIHCIEPWFETFQVLRTNLGKHKNIFFHQIAIGEKNGELDLFQGEIDSTMQTLANNDKLIQRLKTNKVKVQTLDDFSNQNGIKHINYLKIDTEGYDLNVLKGAEKLLKQSIDFIEVEAGMNPRNKYHVPFFDLKTFLEEKGYLMFGFYDQVHEWIEQKPFLRRSNLLFISRILADNHKM